MVRCYPQPDCTGWPRDCAKAQPDADIAGIGVVISFAAAAAITLVASIAGHLLRPSSDLADLPPLDPRRHFESTQHDTTIIYRPNSGDSATDLSDQSRLREAKRRMSNIPDRLILSLSDQQLAACFAIVVTALVRYCQISVYHLNLITDLAWFWTITHLLSIIVLRHYWLQDSKKLTLYVRGVLIILAMAMLSYAVLSLLLWSGGNLSCLAICGYNDPKSGLLLSWRPLLAIWADICIVFWVYPTTCLFVFPLWYKFYHFIMWRIPGHIFGSLQRLRASDTDAQSFLNRLTQSLSNAYRTILFPSQGFAIVVQVLVWCLRFAILVMDRLWTQEWAVSDPGAENQLGFGQLLALIILFLPFLTLLESWSGQFSILIIYYL